jgi:predicted  nucleic acid-binding Zn-ribbon protein
MLMSEYIHQDDAYAWLRDKEIQFAEDDFAKVQAERDALKAKLVEMQTELDRITKEYARGQ